MTEPDIFEPYEKLITVTICGEERQVPENNSILRCFQYLDMERVSLAELCWNGDCNRCQVWIKNGEKERAVMACRTKAAAGMTITRVSDELV